MLTLLIGLFIGAFLGIGIMSILSMNKTFEELSDADDRDRLDFLANGYSITYRNGMWGVVGGVEPKVVGLVENCPRKAIDSARLHSVDLEEVNG